MNQGIHGRILRHDRDVLLHRRVLLSLHSATPAGDEHDLRSHRRQLVHPLLHSRSQVRSNLSFRSPPNSNL